MSQKKLKIVRPILGSRAEAEKVVTSTCAAQLDREKLVAKRDAKIAEITAEFAPRIEVLDEEIATSLTLLEQWADADKGTWGDAKSTVVAGARIGFRTGNPTVEPTGKLTFKAILAALRKRGGDLFAKYVRVKESFDKDAALATGRLLESADAAVRQQAEEELDAIGVEIVQSESFYLDPPREGQADVTLSKEAA